MEHGTSSVEHEAGEPQRGPFAFYHRTPLAVRIMVALLIGVGVGYLLKGHAAVFKPFSDIVLRLLGLLATPLIFIAVVHALVKAEISGKTAARLLFFLFTNTLVAIFVGLLVANILQP